MDERFSVIDEIQKLLPRKPQDALECCLELRGFALEKRKVGLLAVEEGFRGRGYMAIDRIPEGKESLGKALGRYRQWKNYNNYSELINAVGADYLVLGSYPRARLWLTAAVRSSIETNTQDVLYKSVYNLAKVEIKEGNLKEGKQYLEKSLEIAGARGEYRIVPRILTSLGDVHLSLGNNEKALEYFSRGHAVSKEQEDWKTALLMGLKIAEILAGAKRLDAAERLYRELLQMAEQQYLYKFDVLVRIGLAKILMKRRQYTMVVYILDMAVKRIEQYPRICTGRGCLEAYELLANYYGEIEQKTDEAEKYYQRYKQGMEREKRE